jgi:multidrug efflux pump subunit AcrA (membrane-fusion protein)
MKAALISPPKVNPESVDIDTGDDRSPDVVALPARARTVRGRRWLPIAVVILLGIAAGVWHWYPQIAGLVGGHSVTAANGAADRPGNGKAALGFTNADENGVARTGAPPKRVRTVSLKVVPRREVLRVTGSLMADERSSVASNTSGIAEKVCVDRGSLVKRGEVLVQIDPTDAKNKLAEGEAMLEELKARLGIEGNGENFDPEKEPEVQVAKASAELAAANFRRAKENVAKKVISTEAFDQVRTENELAAQRYRQSRFQINQAFRAYQTAEAKLKILRKAVDDTTIRAPFDGWVAEKLVAPGEQISAGMQATKVVTLVRVDPLRLSLTVPQQDIGGIKTGQPVRYRMDSFPNEVFDAEVRFVAPVVTNDTRTMVVEALAKNRYDKAGRPMLVPGLFATAEISLPTPEESDQGRYGQKTTGPAPTKKEERTTVLAPASAVLRTGEISRVFVVRDGIAREQVVALGDSDGQTVEIASGLTGKETLVADPGLVHDGDAVTR